MLSHAGNGTAEADIARGVADDQANVTPSLICI
jgi:hypothetical protein